MDPSSTSVIETFTLGPFATNCYLVRASSQSPDCWIVDAGFSPAAMIQRVIEGGLRPTLIVLTHAHADHIAGLAEIKEAFSDAPTLIHRAEADWLADPESNLSAALGEAITAPEADRLIDGGETLTLGQTQWRVFHTPGHSPGGITLWSEQIGAAIVGDTLFAGSIGRFDFPSSDGDRLFESIRRTLYALPEQTAVYPGHGPATSIGREKQSNPFVRA